MSLKRTQEVSCVGEQLINSSASADNHQMSHSCNLTQTGGLEHDGNKISRLALCIS